MQQHAASFIAHTEASTGSELPRFIKDEFDAFLECGILAHGLLRLRCGDCGHDKLLAFSCKRRGFCPSCGARRMSRTLAHLVDHVIPHVPVRQWVLSLRSDRRLQGDEFEGADVGSGSKAGAPQRCPATAISLLASSRRVDSSLARRLKPATFLLRSMPRSLDLSTPP